MNKKIICIILIIAILEYFCTFVFAENSLTNTVTNEIASDTIDGQTEELRKQNEEMNNKINETNEKLEYVKEELSDTMLKVQETEDKVLEYEKQVKELGQKMNELQSSIDEATANLEIASQDYNAKSDMLAQRLVAMYEAGDTSYLDVLLKSSSLTDFLSRYYAIEELTKYDSELIDRVEKEKNNIEQTREKLEAEQAEIKIVKAKSEQTTVVLNNMKTLQQSYVERLSTGEKTLQEQITAYKKEQAEIAVCDMKLYYEDTKTFQITRGCNGKEKIDFIDNGLAASACNKLFKREIMEQYPFAEGKVNEDIAVVIPALVKAKKIAYVPDVFYYYVQRDNSIQNSHFSEKRFDIFAGVDSTLKRIEKEEDYELYKDAIVFNQLISLFLYVFPKIENTKKKKKYLKKFNELSQKYNIRQNRFYWRFLSTTNKKSQIYYRLLFKFECTGHYNFANATISFLKFFQNHIKKKIIPPIDEKLLIKEAQKNRRRKENDFKISVVIPNYNYERFLEERLYSVLNQKVKIFEILLLDDCSTDNSREKIDHLVEVLEEYINIKKVYNKENSGSAFKQWKKGFEMSKGDYVWIAEADDYCDKDLLKTLVKPLKKEDNIRISYCDTAYINGVGKKILKSIKSEIDIMKTGHWDHDFINEGKEEIKNYAFLNCTIANVSSALIKKDDYHQYFELSGKFKQAGDWLFYVNVMKNGKIAYSSKTLNYYRVHGNNVSSVTKKDAHLKEIKQIHAYFDKQFKLTSFQKEQIEKRYKFLEKVWNLKKEKGSKNE